MPARRVGIRVVGGTHCRAGLYWRLVEGGGPGKHPDMRTDQVIYEFLATGPEAFRVLTAGLRLTGEYCFRSLTFKALERRADGVYEPVGHTGPVYLIEFQAQRAAHAWYNLLTKVGLYGEANPEADVRGILIFLNERDDPGLPTGIGAADPPFKAVSSSAFAH